MAFFSKFTTCIFTWLRAWFKHCLNLTRYTWDSLNWGYKDKKYIFICNPLVLQLLHCNWIQQHARGMLHKNVAGIWPHETSDTHLQSIWWVFLQDLGYTCILCPIPYEMWTLHTWWSLKLCSIQLWGVGMDLNLYPSAIGIQQHTKLSHNDYIYWKKGGTNTLVFPPPTATLLSQV